MFSHISHSLAGIKLATSNSSTWTIAYHSQLPLPLANYDSWYHDKWKSYDPLSLAMAVTNTTIMYAIEHLMWSWILAEMNSSKHYSISESISMTRGFLGIDRGSELENNKFKLQLILGDEINVFVDGLSVIALLNGNGWCIPSTPHCSSTKDAAIKMNLICQAATNSAIQSFYIFTEGQLTNSCILHDSGWMQNCASTE